MIYRNGIYYDRMIRNGITYDRMIRNGVQYGQSPAPTSGYTINLTLSGTPTDIRFADLKYNKQCVFQQDWDDSALTAMDGLAKFNTMSFDDGTGKPINWRGSLGAMGRANFNNAEIGASPGSYLTYAQLETLIASGWDIANHAMYGTDTGNFNNGGDKVWDLSSLQELIFEKIGYPINTSINTSNIQGYSIAAEATGHLVNTGTASECADTFPCLPGAGWAPLTDIEAWPDGFVYLIRHFSDTWDSGTLTDFQNKTNAMLSDSNASVHKLLRLGTHNSGPSGWATMMDYVASADTTGKMWMCSLRELMEYLRVRSDGAITVNGGTVSVEVPAGLRWEDFTLIVEGATVTDASSPDADDITFNGGLVNFYRDNFG